jgi:predicted nucleic acid-binding protein
VSKSTLAFGRDNLDRLRAAERAWRSAPIAPVAREAARLRSLNISLADGFALATARAHAARIAAFDRRVRRSVEAAGVELAPTFR